MVLLPIADCRLPIADCNNKLECQDSSDGLNCYDFFVKKRLISFFYDAVDLWPK